jgi:hypothetical protein
MAITTTKERERETHKKVNYKPQEYPNGHSE